MKTLKVLVLIIAFSLLAGSAWACYYDFEASSEKTQAGDTVDVKVSVIYEHRRCIIELTDTQFNLTNMELLGESEWNEDRRGTYSKILTLKPVSEGKAVLEVVRECSKKGVSSAEWTVEVTSPRVVVN